MTRFDNTAEGGSNGSPVASADVGSGTSWSQTSGSPTYSASAALSGSLSIVFSTAATQFVAWSDTPSGSAAYRFEFSVPSAPSGQDQRILDIRSSSASLGNVTMASAGLALTANAGSVTTAASVPVSAGLKYTGTLTMAGWGSAASSVTLKLYDSTGALVDTKSASGGTTGSTISTIRLGRPTPGASGMAAGFKVDNVAQDIGTAVEIPPVVSSFSGSLALSGAGSLGLVAFTLPPYVGGEHLRYFKNYDYDRLALEVDQRGFIVGQSRLGVTKLRSSLGSWTSLKADFVSIGITMSCRIVDGAWLEPEVSSLSLVSRSASAFAAYDGSELRLRYDGGTIFSGVVAESTLSSEIGEDNTEEFTVGLIARGYETIKNSLPAVGTATTLYGALYGGSTPVIQWVGGKVRRRAADITARTVVAEDARADVQLEEQVATENDVSGFQGELLADLAIRSGLLLDQSSGSGVSFRSYQGVPLWEMEDKHLVSGYALAVDRDTTTALAMTRKENEAYVRAYRAGTARVITERTISMFIDDDFAASSFAAYVPLQGDPKRYLVNATLPRSDDLPIPSRLPIQARFRHGGATYRGAVIGMQHTITKERWMTAIECAPVHLATRVGDLAPTSPAHVKVSLVGTTANLTWTTVTAGVVQSVGSSAFSLLTADADNVDVGDELRWHTAAGVLKEDTIFRVLSKGTPSGGLVLVGVTPALTASFAAGDVLRFSDYGPPPDGGWTVWYATNGAQNNKKIHPETPGVLSFAVNTFSASASISLTSGFTYRFTVYANSTTPNVRSAPSKYVEVVVP